MTTIVYRAGVLAADTRAYSGTVAPMGKKKKVFALDDGSIIGLSTASPGTSEAVKAWLEAGADINATPSIEPNFTALHIMPNGEVFYYHEGFLPSGPLEADYLAIGSGQEYAYGALAQGATAKEAVVVASGFDTFTNDDVMELTLEDALPKKKKKPTKIGF